jgi:hypothetical protein
MGLPLQPAPEAPKAVPVVEKAEPVVLASKAGVVLGSMQREGSRVFVRPDNHISFNIQTAPFNNFLVEKVLAPMHQKHAEFNYDIIQTDNVLGEVMLTGVSDEALKSLLGSFRWTFEKMYEKQSEPKGSAPQPAPSAASQPSSKPVESTASPKPAQSVPKRESPVDVFKKRYCPTCTLEGCDPDKCLRILEVLFLGDIRDALDKLASRPAFRGGGGQRKDPPKERHVDGGISWFWNDAHTYEKALDAENKDSKDYVALKKMIEDAVSAGKKGLVIGEFWCFLDSFKKDGILRKKAQDFSNKGGASK